MNRISDDSTFNDNFQILTKEKDVEKIKKIYSRLLTSTTINENLPSDLRSGIKISILKSIITLIDLGINPISMEILPEYQVLISEIIEVYESLKPEKESNWIEECIHYGDKKAYHWDWKHYGSKELF